MGTMGGRGGGVNSHFRESHQIHNQIKSNIDIVTFTYIQIFKYNSWNLDVGSVLDSPNQNTMFRVYLS